MSSQQNVTDGERRRMIAEAAYFRAERRGFRDGDAIRDWCEAEAEIDARLLKLEDGQLVERLEQALASASKRLAAARRKLGRLSREARSEWEKDLDRLVALRDALKPKLAELEAQGQRAGRRLREQAESVRDELVDLVERLETRAKR